ncbi:MAG: enolase C-terminal domain-like protein [Bacteroidota bacterium]
MIHWSIEKKILELKYTWKISRNASDSKTNLFVKVGDSMFGAEGEVAPNIRYHETPEQVEKEFQQFLTSKPEIIQSSEELTEFLERVQVSHALRFGIESAYIHYWCAKRKISVQEFLGIETVTSTPISYSIPIMDVGKMKSFYEENNLQRFPFIKIKVNADDMTDAVTYLSTFCGQPLIVDANEAFQNVEDCIHTLEKIRKRRIEFIEQPMPSSMQDESIYLKKHSPFTLFADESVTDKADFSQLKQMFDGINVKLMKAGGYLNAVRLLKEARANKMKTMIGCMVETTLAISSGLHLCALADYADLDSFLVVKNEPYGLVKEENGILSSNVLIRQ